MRKYGIITKGKRASDFNEEDSKGTIFLYFLVLVPFSARAGYTIYALVQCTVTMPDIPASLAP